MMVSRTRVSRCYVRAFPATLCALSLAFGAASAQAETRYVQSGQFSTSFALSLGGVAVEQSSGDVYVVGSAGNEVKKFNAAGVFILSFGGGVDQTSGANVCTAASGHVCQPGSAGAGNGQFGGGPNTGPTSVAVDQASGDVYVTDGVNNRVEKFDSSGNYLSQFNGSGTPAAGFSFPNAIAVDPSSADVYVVDAGHGVVDRFSSAGVYLCQVTGQGTPSASECNSLAGSATPAGSFSFPSEGEANPAGLAVDSTGRLYVGDVRNHVIDEFDSSGAYQGQLGAGTLSSPTELTVDSSNNVFVVDYSGPLIVEFDSGGNQLGSSPMSIPGFIYLLRGVAVNDASHSVYLSKAAESSQVLIFGPITVPGVTTGVVSNVQQTTANLNGVINPDGVQVTDCHFQYTDNADFEVHGYSGPDAQSVPCVPNAASIPADHGDHNVTADITGLSPTTTYHFRLLAANASGVIGHSHDSTFATPGPPTIESTSAANVTSTSADLQAQINPNLFDTHYHFEYVDDATFQGSGFAAATKAPQPDADLGSTGSDQAAGVHVQGLQPGTTYHYRVLADNGYPPAAAGPAHTFTTQPIGGGSVVLPDGRAYELVTPPDKGDGILASLGGPTLHIFGFQASVSGDKMTYVGYTPFPGSQSGAFYTSYLASRGASGWSSQGLTPPQAVPDGSNLYPRFAGYSADLSKGALEDGGGGSFGQDSPLLVSGEPPNNLNLFLRDNSDGSYQLADVAPSGATPSGATFDGASADYSHVVFDERAQLTANAPAGEDLYVWAGGTVRLVSVLPDNTPVSGITLGNGQDKVFHAVSDDASRIFFTANGNLYVRENGAQSQSPLDSSGHCEVPADACTMQVDASQGGPDPSGGGSFITATPDGSKVFFTSSQRLTSDSTVGDLYQYDVTNGHLTDLTVDNADNNGPQVHGVVGASSDGSYVYFVAAGKLASGATAGENNANLYVEHNGTTTFIARLNSGGDDTDWVGIATTARVTPDGTHLAFDSINSLTGYDNTIASGNGCYLGFLGLGGGSPRCNEVFLYDAVSRQLVCASCNPSGARPIGPSTISPSIRADEGLNKYLPRALSDNGRVFFESLDAIVPQDTNGTIDVYEYNGHPWLISSGKSGDESKFWGASASGNDVFFTTSSRLVGQDTDDKFDIYDAHVCSEAVPCFATPPVPSPACTTGDSCRAAPSSQPAIFGAPPSATFSGAGNLAPLSSKPVVKPKGLTRAQKLSKALKACKKRPKRMRASCVAQAHRRHGTKASARKTAKRSTARSKRGGLR
jgi:hypothetical protein